MTDSDDHQVGSEDESAEPGAETLSGWGESEPGSGWSKIGTDEEPAAADPDYREPFDRRAPDAEEKLFRRRRPSSLRSKAIDSSAAALGDRVANPYGESAGEVEDSATAPSYGESAGEVEDSATAPDQPAAAPGPPAPWEKILADSKPPPEADDPGKASAAQRLAALFGDKAQKDAETTAGRTGGASVLFGSQLHGSSDAAEEQGKRTSVTDRAHKISSVANLQTKKLASLAGDRAQKLTSVVGEQASKLTSVAGEQASKLPGVGGRSSDLPDRSDEQTVAPETESRKLPRGVGERSQQVTKLLGERPELSVLAAFLGGLLLATILKRLARR